MKLDDMLRDGAPVPVTPESIHTLVREVKRLRRASDTEALAFYAFTAALVQKAGGQVELSAEEQEAAKTLQLEVADKPDGSTVVRVSCANDGYTSIPGYERVPVPPGSVVIATSDRATVEKLHGYVGRNESSGFLAPPFYGACERAVFIDGPEPAPKNIAELRKMIDAKSSSSNIIEHKPTIVPAHH